jgi:uncharacterized protein (DUF2252 family)
MDAAYWVKGCSSLGRLRFAVLLGVGKRLDEDGALCLMDIKEAVPAIPPCLGILPQDDAVRVVTGARHLSPALGERMIAARLLDKPVFLHIAGPYLLRFAQESAWRRSPRDPNGFQVDRVAALAMRNKPSVDFCGYWQRHLAATPTSV